MLLSEFQCYEGRYTGCGAGRKCAPCDIYDNPLHSSFPNGLQLDRARSGGQCSDAMADDKNDISQMSFEEALRALEELVRKLESGDVPLDESITLYERGEQLRSACQKRLDAVQARIEKIVTGPDGQASGTQSFDNNG